MLLLHLSYHLMIRLLWRLTFIYLASSYTYEVKPSHSLVLITFPPPDPVFPFPIF